MPLPPVRPAEVPTVLANIPGPVPDPKVDDTWKKYQKLLSSMISKWDQEELPRIKTRRELRANRKNVQELRELKKILGDETIIADHTISSNIKREKAPYVAYLEQSRRILIFKPEKLDPTAAGIEHNIRNLELAFTRGMRYNRWKLSWYKILDSMLLHGGTAIEVVFDDSKPLQCAIEFIPREDLIFALPAKNIQANELVCRRYKLFANELENLAKKNGFKPDKVKELVDRLGEDRSTQTEIFKVYYKAAGVVNICWYAKDNLDSWLKDPEPHLMGLFKFPVQGPEQANFDPKAMQAMSTPVPVTIFPIFYLKYEECEEDELIKAQGIASRDMYVQEAIENLFSGAVNGVKRASGVYPSVAPSTTGDAPSGNVIGPVQHGMIMDRHLAFFQMQYPNVPSIVATVQAIATRNLQQAGQVDFAALTRSDTEKTATEITTAKEQSVGLTGINISIFSTIIQEVYTFCWEIGKSQALVGNAYLVPPADMKLLMLDYILTAAGDIEVVERAEKTQKLLQIWDEVKTTPAALLFFKLLVEYAFPDEAEAIIRAMDASDPKTDMIQKLIGVIQNLPHTNFKPNEQAQLGALVAAAQALVAQPGSPPAAGSSRIDETGPPEAGNVVGGQFSGAEQMAPSAGK